eukprot:Awhi_evm1s665
MLPQVTPSMLSVGAGEFDYSDDNLLVGLQKNDSNATVGSSDSEQGIITTSALPTKLRNRPSIKRNLSIKISRRIDAAKNNAESKETKSTSNLEDADKVNFNDSKECVSDHEAVYHNNPFQRKTSTLSRMGRNLSIRKRFSKRGGGEEIRQKYSSSAMDINQNPDNEFTNISQKRFSVPGMETSRLASEKSMTSTHSSPQSVPTGEITLPVNIMERRNSGKEYLKIKPGMSQDQVEWRKIARFSKDLVNVSQRMKKLDDEHTEMKSPVDATTSEDDDDSKMVCNPYRELLDDLQKLMKAAEFLNESE